MYRIVRALFVQCTVESLAGLARPMGMVIDSSRVDACYQIGWQMVSFPVHFRNALTGHLYCTLELQPGVSVAVAKDGARPQGRGFEQNVIQIAMACAYVCVKGPMQFLRSLGPLFQPGASGES